MTPISQLSTDDILPSPSCTGPLRSAFLSWLSRLLQARVVVQRSLADARPMVFPIHMLPRPQLISSETSQHTHPEQKGHRSRLKRDRRATGQKSSVPIGKDESIIGSRVYFKVDNSVCNIIGASCFHKTESAAQFIAATLHTNRLHPTNHNSFLNSEASHSHINSRNRPVRLAPPIDILAVQSVDHEVSTLPFSFAAAASTSSTMAVTTMNPITGGKILPPAGRASEDGGAQSETWFQGQWRRGMKLPVSPHLVYTLLGLICLFMLALLVGVLYTVAQQHFGSPGSHSQHNQQSRSTLGRYPLHTVSTNVFHRRPFIQKIRTSKIWFPEGCNSRSSPRKLVDSTPQRYGPVGNSLAAYSRQPAPLSGLQQHVTMAPSAIIALPRWFRRSTLNATEQPQKLLRAKLGGEFGQHGGLELGEVEDIKAEDVEAEFDEEPTASSGQEAATSNITTGTSLTGSTSGNSSRTSTTSSRAPGLDTARASLLKLEDEVACTRPFDLAGSLHTRTSGSSKDTSLETTTLLHDSVFIGPQALVSSGVAGSPDPQRISPIKVQDRKMVELVGQLPAHRPSVSPRPVGKSQSVLGAPLLAFNPGPTESSEWCGFEFSQKLESSFLAASKPECESLRFPSITSSKPELSPFSSSSSSADQTICYTSRLTGCLDRQLLANEQKPGLLSDNIQTPSHLLVPTTQNEVVSQVDFTPSTSSNLIARATTAVTMTTIALTTLTTIKPHHNFNSYGSKGGPGRVDLGNSMTPSHIPASGIRPQPLTDREGDWVTTFHDLVDNLLSGNGLGGCLTKNSLCGACCMDRGKPGQCQGPTSL
ncbi:unnamed protein product [Protopolystoma xenopodis]|uniref:Notch NODP domain-containing protein n=1 Tax=Protopolystoma xenopodis TaxID=117903 RepID=A0A3S5FG81_9PLAT|nr:unnamed protein product [Protopolystoma xenopodis]